MSDLDRFPEHKKMDAVINEMRAIGDFLEWALETHRMYLCQPVEETSHMIPILRPMVELVAEFYGIDLKEIEKERRQMLEETRRLQ